MKEINLNEKFFLFNMIDYSKPAPHPLLAPKPIKMSEVEAHSRNQAFALNRASQRYVKQKELNQ